MRITHTLFSASISIVVSGFHLTATASPKAGDKAVYEQVQTNRGQSVRFTLKDEITFIDSETGEVTIEETITAQDGTIISDEYNPWTIKELETQDYIVDHCAEIASSESPDGTKVKPETITVPAGTFNTCHFKTKFNDLYLGHVPTGTVKDTQTLLNGSTISLTLLSFEKH
jgi:hypothetical protein